MTTIDSRNPRAATCEDWEEDQEQDTSLLESDSNTDANVARKRSQSRRSTSKPAADLKSHNGSDSGYSSKAGTNENISTGRKKATDLRVDTEVVMERERQPYTQRPARPILTHASPKKKDIVKERGAKQQHAEVPFRHPQGLCPICETYGYHIEPAPPAIATKAHSPKASKTTTRPVDDSAAHVRPRRSSSKREGRPVSVFIVAPPHQPVHAPEYAQPVPHAYAYPYQLPSPVTPSTNMVPYHYYPQPQHLPDTPISASYSATPGSYLEAYAAPHSAYYQHAPAPTYFAAAAPVQLHYSPHPVQEPILYQHRPSHGAEPRPVIKTNRSIEEDRRAMPPPSRPGLKKSTTERISKRQSVHYESDDRPDVTSKRLSREYTHPPTAYRAPPSGTASRPRPSKSYSTGSEPIVVPSTSRPRHNTDPSRYKDYTEQQTADAEYYIEKTSRIPAQELTAESLRKISSRPLASDAGTHKSKESSRSKLSTSGKTTILINNGVSVSLPQDITEPLSLQLGNMTLSVTGQDQFRPSTRQSESRPPNDNGRSQSHRSTTTSSIDGQSLRREGTRKSEQTEPTTHSASSSRKSSRPPSSTVANVEYERRRQPPDVLNNPEAFYGA